MRRGIAVVLAAAVVAGLVPLAFVMLGSDSDEVGSADAVMVLGGGGGERFDVGRPLSMELDAELVLSADAIERGRDHGLDCDEDVRCVWPDPVSTAGEARAARKLVRHEAWDRLVVVTSDFHVARARLLFRQCVDDVRVVAATDRAGPLQLVWRHARESAAMIAAVTVSRAC